MALGGMKGKSERRRKGGNKRNTLIALQLFEAHWFAQRTKLLLSRSYFINSFSFVETDKFHPFKIEGKQ
jgi:hypothetical protein